jgi:hypothetical protein
MFPVASVLQRPGCRGAEPQGLKLLGEPAPGVFVFCPKVQICPIAQPLYSSHSDGQGRPE